MTNVGEYKTTNIKFKYLAEYARFSIKGHNFGSELVFPFTHGDRHALASIASQDGNLVKRFTFPVETVQYYHNWRMCKN
jgi:hypothetical protein